jgi:DNA invertase Pin-like site-specific DNA recombinase
MEMKKLIAYYRVSTKKQGVSGLGLEAQESSVQDYAARSRGQILQSYKEVESGKNSERPALAKAITQAKLTKSTLVIAKLDRLARNLHFVSALMESGVDFVCCDIPDANRLTIHILAAVAEAESKAISDRTKAALAAAKKRGVKLGANRKNTFNALRRAEGWKKGTKVAAKVRTSRTKEAYEGIMPDIHELRHLGSSYREIARWLNDRHYTTSTGKPWSSTAVLRVVERYPA